MPNYEWVYVKIAQYKNVPFVLVILFIKLTIIYYKKNDSYIQNHFTEKYFISQNSAWTHAVTNVSFAWCIDRHYMADGFHTGFLNPRGIHRAECPECIEGSFPDNGSAGRIKKQNFITDTALC